MINTYIICCNTHLRVNNSCVVKFTDLFLNGNIFKSALSSYSYLCVVNFLLNSMHRFCHIFVVNNTHSLFDLSLKFEIPFEVLDIR